MTIKQVFFDFGGVLIEWNPKTIAAIHTNDTVLRTVIEQDIFGHQDWLDLDRGDFTEQESSEIIAARTGLTSDMVLAIFDTVRRSFISLQDTVEVLKN